MTTIKCGAVSEDGQITSNANFSSPQQSSPGQYYVDYNGGATNPVPVISLTSQAPGMTCVLNDFSSGFRLYVYDMNQVPMPSSFNFIVGEMV